MKTRQWEGVSAKERESIWEGVISRNSWSKELQGVQNQKNKEEFVGRKKRGAHGIIPLGWGGEGAGGRMNDGLTQREETN